MDKAEVTRYIKQRATDLGFQYCGISKAGFLEEEAPRLEKWLNQNKNGQMSWMGNYFDKRLDPTLLHPGAKSVVSFALNYFPKQKQEADTYKIAKYAYGKDYHHIIKGKLKILLEDLTNKVGSIDGRAFVDSAPIMDKAWAKRSGIGWMGKNTNIIIKKGGSFFFLAELVLDIELEYDGPIRDYCGTCTRCLDACPTDALEEPYKINGSKCISYYTIELKDAISESVKGKFNDWMFGCDICQDVCPWNRLSKPHNEPLLDAHSQLFNMNKSDWEDITREVFNEVFRKSAVKRTKYEGLLRNIKFIKE